MVRDNLESGALHRKDQYGTHDRPIHYPIGTWVYYYLPRKSEVAQISRRTISSRQASGPVNVEIQRSRMSKPIITHVYKLKFCHQPGLQSWLLEGRPY